MANISKIERVSNEPPRMRAATVLAGRVRVRMATGMHCPWCRAGMRIVDVEDTDAGWRLICSQCFKIAIEAEAF